eukprot:7779231-Pyramimonas_sp.AAC.1
MAWVDLLRAPLVSIHEDCSAVGSSSPARTAGANQLALPLCLIWPPIGTLLQSPILGVCASTHHGWAPLE